MGESRGRPATTDGAGGRRRVQAVDLAVARRIRRRRVAVGLTQQRLAELVGVTYQQAHKYEVGASRISAGRLHRIAQALGTDVACFFRDEAAADHAPTLPAETTPRRRLLLELARDFVAIGDPRQQEAICRLARALASSERVGQTK